MKEEINNIHSLHQNSIVDIHTVERLLRIKFPILPRVRKYLLTQKRKELAVWILSLMLVVLSGIFYVTPHPKEKDLIFLALYLISTIFSILCFSILERASYQSYYDQYPGLKLWRKNFQDVRIILMHECLKANEHLNKKYIDSVIEVCKKYETLKTENEKFLLQHPVLSILVTLFTTGFLDWLIQKQNPEMWILVLCAIGMLIGFTLLIISRETKLTKVQTLRTTLEGLNLLGMYEPFEKKKQQENCNKKPSKK